MRGPIFTNAIYENWPLPLSHAASPQRVMEPAGLSLGGKRKHWRLRSGSVNYKL